jgi:hypothetical protein
MKHVLKFIAALAFIGSAHAAPPDVSTLRPFDLEFVAWSTDSSLILVKMTDPNSGVLYQVREAKTGEVLRVKDKPMVFPSQEAPGSDEEKKFIKQLMTGKKVKVDGAPVVFDQVGVAEGAHPTKEGLALMTLQKKERFIIIGVRGEKASAYRVLDVIKDKRGIVAKANQKALVWDAKGKNFCLIYRQKLESEDTPFEGDFIHVEKFVSSRVKGAEESEGGDSE